jgi:hypothetical protein
LNVLIDVNGGHNRTGIEPEHALPLARAVHQLKGDARASPPQRSPCASPFAFAETWFLTRFVCCTVQN